MNDMNKEQVSVPEGFVDMEIADGFASHIGPLYWRLDKAETKIGFHVLEHHLNPGKTLHGGVMMTIADMAVGFAANWELEITSFTPSVNNNYDFLRPGLLGQWLQTETEIVQTTKRMSFARGFLMGPDGPVLRYNGIMKIPSDTDPRYKLPSFVDRMERLLKKHKNV